jgi:hypothetical protein
MPRREWKPLLDAGMVDQAWEAIHAVAARLLASGSATMPRTPEEAAPVPDPSLSSGTAGLAVLFAYLDRALPGEGHDETAFRFLETATAAVATRRMVPWLYGGFTGVAWTVAHLEDGRPDPGDDEPSAIDRALLDYLARTPWIDDYDLIGGLVGYGVYGLERLPSAAGRAVLERVIDRLAELAERAPAGATWFTPPQLLPDWQRQLNPNGYYNLGLAHGVPGVIALLGAACAAGIREPAVRPLLAGAVRWLLAQQLPEGEARFPSWTGPGVARSPGRLAWCYGDLGVAAALLVAARGAENEVWEREAVRIALAAAARSPEEAGVADPGLCHGAAGNGHLFNRLYQATGEPRLAEAARFWFAEALRRRRPGQGIGGFQALATADARGAPAWVDEPGILMGAAGIALALLAAITPLAPEWDRLLLVSTAPGFPANAGKRGAP